MKKPRLLAVPRISADQFLSSMQDANNVSVNFLKIDLETALTFSGMALQSSDPVKKQRNTHAARRAYETILHLRTHASPKPADSALLSNGLRTLKSDLIRLGEVL
jgi:hypothetical protein